MRDLIDHIQRDNRPLNEVSWGQVAGGAALIGALATASPGPALAQQQHHAPKHHHVAAKHYTENDYVDAIVGEASSKGYSGMLDIACAIRNRIKSPKHAKRPLKQVYGYKANHNKSEPQEVWDAARKAWADSAKQDTVNGATLWGNAKDVEKFNTTWDMSRVDQTVSRHGHTFFAEK